MPSFPPPAMPSFSYNDLLTISPMLWVVIGAMVVLMVDLILPRDRKSQLVGISFVSLLISGFYCVYLWDKDMTAFNGTVIADNFALLFQGILLIVAALSIALSEKYIQQKGINYGEYYALMLFSTSGAMLMATSRELITIFVGLEVLSIALYVLSGFARTEARSEESAMKYFLLGSFSSGFFLYGIALVYGGASTTRLDLLAALPISTLASPYTVAGVALLIVGLGFKAAIVPFHSWTPDVYEGAPTSVTAFMSAGAKAGAFAAFIRVALTFLPVSAAFHDVIWVLAILTMVAGNVLAAVQSNIKRMLAYSSIAHAGYILVGLLAQNAEGRAGILFYVLAYTFMNLGAFGVLILLARRGSELNTIDDLKGLAVRQPLAAAVMAVFMFSLGGVPPSAGFMGKFYLFIAAIHAHLYGLSIVGLLASVIGAFYYLRVVYTMFFEQPQREFPTNVWRFSPGASVALAVSVFFTLLLQLIPSGMYKMSLSGANSLTPSGAPPAISRVSPPPAVSPIVKTASLR